MSKGATELLRVPGTRPLFKDALGSSNGQVQTEIQLHRNNHRGASKSHMCLGQSKRKTADCREKQRQMGATSLSYCEPRSLREISVLWRVRQTLGGTEPRSLSLHTLTEVTCQLDRKGTRARSCVRSLLLPPTEAKMVKSFNIKSKTLNFSRNQNQIWSRIDFWDTKGHARQRITIIINSILKYIFVYQELL